MKDIKDENFKPFKIKLILVSSEMFKCNEDVFDLAHCTAFNSH